MPKKPLPISNKIENKNDNLQTLQRKNYIPLYLRKNARRENKQNLNQSAVTDEVNIAIKENALQPPGLEPKPDFNLDLLQFQTKITNVNFLVLHNEIENNESANEGYPRNVSDNRRAMSPSSQNSSTCSSPNSIATVRAVRQNHRSKHVVSNRRHSASSHVTYPKNSETDDTTPSRNKRYTKRSKSAKSTDDKVCENKENVPQTSRQFNANKGTEKFSKSAFMGKKKVFIAQLKESSNLQSSANITSKSKPQKSNIEMVKKNSFVKKSSDSSPISAKPSQKSDMSFLNQDTLENLENSNMVLVLKPHKHVDNKDIVSPAISADSLKIASASAANHRLITDWIDNSKSVEKQSSNILLTMRQLLEETLDFINADETTSLIDSETIILDSNSVNINYSPTSFKTIITNEDDSIILQNELERALNRSFDNSVAEDDSLSLDDAKLAVTDFDMLSFKSVTSLSKFSEYLSADNLSEAKLEEISSMQDIYERKEPPLSQVTNLQRYLILLGVYFEFILSSCFHRMLLDLWLVKLSAASLSMRSRLLEISLILATSSTRKPEVWLSK